MRYDWDFLNEKSRHLSVFLDRAEKGMCSVAGAMTQTIGGETFVSNMQVMAWPKYVVSWTKRWLDTKKQPLTLVLSFKSHLRHMIDGVILLLCAEIQTIKVSAQMVRRSRLVSGKKRRVEWDGWATGEIVRGMFPSPELVIVGGSLHSFKQRIIVSTRCCIKNEDLTVEFC